MPRRSADGCAPCRYGAVHPGNPLPAASSLAFCLAHPALHRKLNFALRQKHVGGIAGSIDVLVGKRGNIYIDAADTTTSRVWPIPRKPKRGCWRSWRRKES